MLRAHKDSGTLQSHLLVDEHVFLSIHSTSDTSVSSWRTVAIDCRVRSACQSAAKPNQENQQQRLVPYYTI